MPQLPADEQPEFIVESRTMSVKAIEAALAGEGYTGFESVEHTSEPAFDQSEDESAEQTEQTEQSEAEAEPVDEQSSTDATAEESVESVVNPASPVKPEGSETTAAATRSRKPGSVRERERREKAEADLQKERAEKVELIRRIEALEKRPADKSTTDKSTTDKPVVAVEAEPKLAKSESAKLDTAKLPTADPEPTEPVEPDDLTYTDVDQYRKDMAQYHKDHSAWIREYAKWSIKDTARQDKVAAIEQEQRERSDKEAANKAELDDLYAKENKKIEERWTEQLDLSRTRHADFDAVMAAPPKDMAPWSQSLRDAMGDSDIAGEVLYYLGTHHDDLLRIVKATALPDKPTPAQVRASLKVALKEIEGIEGAIQKSQSPAAETAAGEDEDTELDQDDTEEYEDEPVAQAATAQPSKKSAPVTTSTTPTATANAVARQGTNSVAAGANRKPVVKPTPKHQPPDLVGSRGGSPSKKTLAQMKPEEIRDLPMEEYARLSGSGLKY